MAIGQKSWGIEVARLTLLLVAAGMAASRIGLVVHECLGHGGFAIAFGGEVTKVKLFWFGGGWITYSIEEPTATIYALCSMGGILVEGMIGVAMWVSLARADARATAAGETNVAIRIARAIGAAAVLHAAWYFATGTWHGYGDGIPTHRAFGDWRYPAGIAGGLVAVAAGFAGARVAAGAFAAVVPGSRKRRIGGALIAIVTTLVVLGGLAVAEFQLRDDTKYGAIMERAGDRKAAKELAAWQREQKKRGIAIDTAAREAEAKRLRERNAEPPFAIPLGVVVAAAAVLGAVRSRTAEGARITRRQLAIASVIGFGSLAAVIALDVLFL